MSPPSDRHPSWSRQVKARSRRRWRRPVMEPLEGRCLLSIGVTTFDDVVADDGLTSLREAIAQAAATPGADTIVLPHQIGGVEGTYALALGELAIDDAGPLTIQADGGPATIDAGGSGRVMSLSAASNASLGGLVITGGSLPDPNNGAGGGIEDFGALTLTGCTVRGNFAAFAGGGLDVAQGATADITDTTFEGNRSLYGGGSTSSGHVTIHGGAFRNNSTTGNGGAIDCIGTLEVTGTLFDGNSTTYSGGAIHGYGGFGGDFPGRVTVTDCTFQNGSAAYGGGLHNDFGTATITDSTFVGNTGSYGGALNTTGHTTISGGEFRGNTATGNSGAIDCTGTLTATGTLFDGNHAGDAAGAIIGYGGFGGVQTGTLDLESCTFTNNTASFAGAVGAYSTSLTLKNSTIKDNSATYDGGGLYANSSGLSIDGSSLDGNTSNNYGGGMFAAYSAGTITDTTFTGNRSLYTSGGGACFSYDYSFNAFWISGGSFAGNSAGQSGGGLFVDSGSTIHLAGTAVAHNTAGSGGGAYVNSGTVTVDAGSFDANTASGDGGGLYDYSGTATITDTTFTGNAATYGVGGGIANQYGSVDVVGGSFVGGSASYGGGINAYGGLTQVFGSTFRRNTASVGGGGLSLGNGTAFLSGSIVDGNQALGFGGGILSFDYSNTITNTQITGNTGATGGGLYNSSNVTVNGSTISGNTGSNGGGLYNSGSASVQGTTIADNKGDGVRVENGNNSTIGTIGAGNTITGNTGAGVAIVGGSYNIGVRGNVIADNGGLAIDLGGDGRTPNDAGDGDAGPNGLQNFPTITGFATGASTRVVGRLNSTPGTTFAIDVYADKAAHAAVSPGDGRRYLGSFSVTTDATGIAAFDQTLAVATSADEMPTATATDPAGNTSEFSDLVPIAVTPTSGLFTSESGAKATFTVALTLPPTANVTIGLSSSNTAEGTVSPASLTFTPANWNVPKVVTVTGVDDALADGAVAYAIVTAPASSADARFNGKDADDVQVTNLDNDFPAAQPFLPLGSLVYDTVAEGRVGPGSPGGVETFPILVDPNQKFTVIVTPEGTDLKPKVTVARVNGKSAADVVGTATAGAAGGEAIAADIANKAVPGTNGKGPQPYEIRVGGDAGTTGFFRVRVIFNATVENESHGGPKDDTPATAQSLDGSFQALNSPGNDAPTPAYADHAAVLGRIAPSARTVPGQFDGSETYSINAYPLGIPAGSSMRYQQIYSASEFAGGGVIDQLRFRRYPYFDPIDDIGLDVQIRLGYAATRVATASPNFAANVGPGSVVVFDGPLHLSSSGPGVPSPFDIVIDVANTFNYDPSRGDLLVDFVVRSSTTPDFRYLESTPLYSESTTTRIWSTSADATTGTVGYLDSVPGPYGLVTQFAFVGDPADVYSLTLKAGQGATIAAAATQGAPARVELLNSAGTTLAIGRTDSGNLNSVINTFLATTTGTYYVRVTSAGPNGGTDYDLVVTRNADFDAEANDTPATAQPLSGPDAGGKRWALGAIVPGTAYAASPASYGFEDIRSTGHAVLQGTDYGVQYLSPSDLGGFQFPFAGGVLDSATLYSDGFLYLTGSAGYVQYLPLNADLLIAGAADSAVHWQVLGSGSSQRLVVQWTDVLFNGGSTDPITFQAVLNEADGSVRYNYLDLKTDAPAYNEGRNTYVAFQGYVNGNSASLAVPTGDAPNAYVGTGKSTRIALPVGLDDYSFGAAAGASLEVETQTPGGWAGFFANNLDPIVRLYDPAGNLVATNDNGSADGRNALLTYKVPAGKGGTYVVEVGPSPGTPTATRGEYVLSVKGANSALPPFQVATTDLPDGALYMAQPTQVDVHFNDVFLLATLQASDLKVDGKAATALTVVSGNEAIFTLPAGLAEGVHTVAIAAGAINDVQGTPISAYTSHFTLDTTAPRVVGSSIQENDVLSAGDLTYTITFSEPLRTTDLATYNIALIGHLRGSYVYPDRLGFDATGTVLTVHYSGLADDAYTFTIYSGYNAFKDLAGNDLDGEALAWPIPPNRSGDGVAGGNFVVDFATDAGAQAIPTPLVPVDPPGSLVYQNGTPAQGSLTYAADTDDFTIRLDAGQTLAVLADPSGAMQLRITVRGPSGAVLGTATAAGSGVEAALGAVPVADAGTYTITIGSADGGLGLYSVRAVVNADLEGESHGGPSNNDVGSAQPLGPSFIPLGPGRDRGAVLGTSGDADVYSLHLDPGQSLSALLRFRDGSAPPLLGARRDIGDNAPAWAALGDVNHDGILDLVSASYYGWSMTVRLGNGDGTFGDPSPFGSGSDQPQEIALADVDGDGNLDVVSANYYGGQNGAGSVTVMRGHGDGTFDPAIGYFAGYYNVGLAVGDVNGDGAPDILTTSTNDSTVQVLLNDGHGHFGSPTAFPVGSNPNGVALGDFNGDGRPDLATTNYNDGTVSVLFGNGDGTFNAGATYSTSVTADKLAIGDLNGDGRPDIVATSLYAGSISVLLNNGDGTFAPAAFYAVPNYAGSVALGDVNGDGALDIVTAAYYNSSSSGGLVSVLLNNGDGTLGPAQTTDTGYTANSVALGDLNGDGRPDAVTANLYGYSLSVLLNLSAPATLELIAPDGVTVLATADATGGAEASLADFVATGGGTYYLRISGPPSARPYTLVATRGAGIEAGGDDDSFDTAAAFSASGAVLGSVGQPAFAQDLTFDELPYQPVDGLHFKGVTFGYQQNGSPSTSADYHSFGPGTTAFVTDPSLVGSTYGAALSLAFDVPVTDIRFGLAFYAFSARTNVATVALYDASSHLISAIALDAAYFGYSFPEALFQYSGAAASRAVITFDSSFASSFALDNLVASRTDAEDWYAVDAAAGEALSFATSTPGDAPGEFVNALALHLEIYDEAGNLVASGTPLADGRNETVTFTPATAGRYRIRVVAQGGTAGDYLLKRL